MSIRAGSPPRCSGCRRLASPKKTARSSTRHGGCSGTGKARSRPVTRAPTSRSWPGCSRGCASCMRPRVVQSPTRSSNSRGPTPTRPTRRRRSWPRNIRARRSRTSPIQRAQPRSRARPVSSWRASPSCATMAARRAGAGSSAAPGAPREISWLGATTATRPVSVRR